VSKITKSAEGEECQVRIPGICNFNPETTILAHLNGGGMGMKNPDYQSAYCCSDCHDALDLRRTYQHDYDTLKLYHLEGVMRTQEILKEKGLIIVK
jgi:hypothetical protein